MTLLRYSLVHCVFIKETINKSSDITVKLQHVILIIQEMVSDNAHNSNQYHEQVEYDCHVVRATSTGFLSCGWSQNCGTNQNQTFKQ